MMIIVEVMCIHVMIVMGNGVVYVVVVMVVVVWCVMV